MTTPPREAGSLGPKEPPLAIEAAGVRRVFGSVVALDRVDLQVRAGEFFSLLGPSGCGKTTFLRLVAGLEVPDMGVLRVAGQAMDGVPAHRRPVNTVFQSYALFPHLNVFNNVAFGLRMKGVPPAEIHRRVNAAMEWVDIAALASRRPAQLSGGQRQRVALARAVVNEPQVLVLDEPLGALDLKLRRQLQVELRALQRRLGITFVHVTHDQDEALMMSDRIGVMNRGRLEQVDTGPALYSRPRTRFVAEFVGACNVIEGTVLGSPEGGLAVETGLGRLRVRAEGGARGRGERITLAVRPERLRLVRGEPEQGAENQVAAQVEERTYAGAETHYRLRALGTTLNVVRMNADQDGVGDPGAGRVSVVIPPEALVVLED